MEWQPSATKETLAERALCLRRIREFFFERQVMEVETPLLAQAAVTDPFIESMPVRVKSYAHSVEAQYYLQTSPEYAMKRLLAAGFGDIYQICKAFRQEEIGRLHNPEFTLLEWYRVGLNHHQLMDDVDELLQSVFHFPKAERITYQALFESRLGINPHLVTVDALLKLASCCAMEVETSASLTKEDWLNLFMTHKIEPTLGIQQPVFVYDYPATMAALSRLTKDNPPRAARVEVYYQGVELGNGFYELQDAKEQRLRFEKDLQYRYEKNLPKIPIDEYLLAALNSGLPECAGIALGLDRLLMLAENKKHIAKVLAFDFSKI